MTTPNVKKYDLDIVCEAMKTREEIIKMLFKLTQDPRSSEDYEAAVYRLGDLWNEVQAQMVEYLCEKIAASRAKK